jgi:hypothetical protein
MAYLKFAFVLVLGLVLGLGIAWAALHTQQLLGASTALTTITNRWKFTDTVQHTSTTQFSTTGTALTRLNGGFCDLNFGTTTSSWIASSTVTVDCQGTNMLASASAVQSALPGVAAWSATGDHVRVQLASSTPGTFYGVWIDGCSASTTAGYITCRLTNGTGAAITPATTTTHWVQYWVDK